MSEPTGTQYAGFWARLLAFLADSAIVFLVSAALLAGFAVALGPEALMPVAFGIAALGLLYWPVMHASGVQGTFGKVIVGLKVTRFDGRPISILRSVWRELGKILSASVLMLGYLAAAVLPRKQALHDLLAATYVVREGPSRPFAALAVAIAGFALPVVVIPMVVDPAVMKKTGAMVEAMVPAERMKQVSGQDLVRQSLGTGQAWASRALESIQGLFKQDPSPPAAPPVSKAAPTKAPSPKPQASAPKPEAPKLEPAKPAPKVVRSKPPPRPSTSNARAGERYNDIGTAVMYQDVEAVNELIRSGKWVDKPDGRGVTPIMMAAERGDLRVAEALLRGGANPRRAVPVAEKRHDAEMLQLLKRYAGR
jgi:uncharacterized RDD family membrane protein YckC